MKLYSIRNRMSGSTEPERREDDRIVHVNGVLILLIAVLLVAVTALVSFLISGSIYKNKLAKEKAYKLVLPSDSDPYKVAKFQDIIDYVSSNFALEYKTDDLIEGAIKGYVDALGDRYSYYIEPGDYTSYNNYITGTYTGIGISCTFEDEGIVVSEVFPDTPAARAGIAEGELISEINGITTKGMEQSMVSSMLGQEGTKVKLKLVGIDQSEREVELEVATISRQSVFGLGYDDGVYYIRISQFDSDTGEEFRQMLKVAENAGMKALVLDLRGNPGGYERQADEVADALLGKGLIAYSQDKSGNRASEVFSDEKEVDVPVVLLVNKACAFLCCKETEGETPAARVGRTVATGLALVIPYYYAVLAAVGRLALPAAVKWVLLGLFVPLCIAGARLLSRFVPVVYLTRRSLPRDGA